MLTTATGAPTDGATVIVSTEPHDRTIFWHQGARLVRGDRLDVAAIFSHDVVILDVDDAPLRRFLTDLPAHTLPSARLLGTLTYLADAGIPDALDDAISAVQSAMAGSNLRAGIVTRGADGSTCFSQTDRWDDLGFGVAAVDTTGAGDAFAGAIAYAMALRWEWPRALRFANAVAGLSTRAVGAQTALPTLPEVAKRLNVDLTSLTR
jgi:sugar/nucleoside kinase (ribokinase family)